MFPLFSSHTVWLGRPLHLLCKDALLVGNKMRSLTVGTKTESEKLCVVFIECGKTASLVIFNYYYFFLHSAAEPMI